MADYQKMYLKLFNQVSDAIAELQRAQQEAEEMYMQDAGPENRAGEPQADCNAKQ